MWTNKLCGWVYTTKYTENANLRCDGDYILLKINLKLAGSIP
jgi:hypothetical protein